MAFTLEIGESAPGFALPGIDGKEYTLEDFAGAKLLVVIFRCNHCPAVIGSEGRINEIHDRYHPQGVDMVGINSNAVEHHANDSFEAMKAHAAEYGIRYPYLRDESQETARAYGALRTPHFYVFDAERRLRYTGRLDDAPRDAQKATTRELADALEALLAGREVAVKTTNPLGCNVKWKGEDAHWMPPEACDIA